jgi:hypothetical protein
MAPTCSLRSASTHHRNKSFSRGKASAGYHLNPSYDGRLANVWFAIARIRDSERFDLVGVNLVDSLAQSP